jgi:hypothetical protein
MNCSLGTEVNASMNGMLSVESAGTPAIVATNRA